LNTTLIAGGVFLITYALIVAERIPRTVSALLGGVTMILLGVVSQEQAFHSIDWNVIFLLIGMMLIAGIMRETGLFQWIAVKAVQLGRGQPMRILILLIIVTAIGSALLDNVTIVILIAPVTLFVASSLGVNPIPFLIAQIFASNIGGMATLVGDPPNILIGSAGNIDFATFAANMAPISLIILIFFTGLSFFLFRKDLASKEPTNFDMGALEMSELISDQRLLIKSLIVLVGVILGFLVHGLLHLEPATIALTGAVVLMLWGRNDPHHLFRDIEWTTLFFFVGLFIAVEAIVEVGIISQAAEAALQLTGGSLQITSMLILWLSAIVSGIIDNIPYTATMIPLVQDLGLTMPIMPLWWSLSMGACLGGNLTLVGAAANVVVANLAENSGYPISFKMFFRYGILVTFISLIFASVYLWFRYLI
jgi:Na+/H+ antiporter NhaD/arsenite permease-like protein